MLLHAMGLTGGDAAAAAMAAAIGWAHDHKDVLSVPLRGPLPGRCRRALRRAWAEVAGEDADAVVFHAAGDPDWRAAWAGRRFDTARRPRGVGAALPGGRCDATERKASRFANPSALVG